MDLNQDPIEAFIHWAERDRLRSPATVRRYRNVLSQIPDPMAATVEVIESWWGTRYHLSPSTRSNELACLRSFYRWALRFDHRDTDPTRRLYAPKVPNKIPRPLSRSDLYKLLGPLTDEAPDLRRAFALGGFGGCRVSEAAGRTWEDIDTEQRIMYVRGKGGKERAVPTSTVLLDYLLPVPQGGGNIVTGGATPYTPDNLQRKINRFMSKHTDGHTFHDLRKRGASIALSKGASPMAVMQMFGWSSLETVQSYAVVGDSELHRIAEMLAE